jgi:hypothetical protein
MRPLDFVLYEGDAAPNTPVHEIYKAMHEPMTVYSEDKEWRIIGYYYMNGHMHLDIEEIAND